MAKKIKLPRFLVAISLCLVLLVGSLAVYLLSYYKADSEAIAAFCADLSVQKTVLEDGSIAFEPNAPLAGIILYPGGKVEHNAYEPLAAALAECGVLAVIVKMPFRLAVFNIHAADGIRELFPNIENWYIGGHSLGGAMAASYLKNHSDTFKGLILLGAYSTTDLSDTSLAVLSVYGSEDKVLNSEKYKENKKHLPDRFYEIVLEGGCHAYFGMYGNQKGDGTPTLSNEAQIKQTADAIFSFVLE